MPKPCASGPSALAIGLINRSTEEERRVQVLVRDNNVDQALRVLKKKMQREGVFREMKLRGHYEKPSEKRVREKAEAIRRARKLARKKLQREGLLPMRPCPPTAPAALLIAEQVAADTVALLVRITLIKSSWPGLSRPSTFLNLLCR
jgi:small subunit ribosomal protein S21